MPTSTHATASATAPPMPLTTGQLNVLQRLSTDQPATAAHLAGTAKLGRSTVTKALAALESAGLARRERGARDGSRSEPDRWFATAASVPTPPADCPDPEAQVARSPQSTGTERKPTAEQTHAEGPASSTRATGTKAEPPQVTREPQAQAAAAPGPRLAKGALRAMVEQHLRTNPERAWTPGAIAKAISRSAGAVTNACEKLLLDGAMEGGLHTWEDKPRRYQYTGTDQK